MFWQCDGVDRPPPVQFADGIERMRAGALLEGGRRSEGQTLFNWLVLMRLGARRVDTEYASI